MPPALLYTPTVPIEIVQLTQDGGALLIHINFRDARPIYEQVKDGFCQLILSGALPPNYKLP